MLSIDEHRVNPAAIVSGPEPFYASSEEAAAALAKYQEAKQSTTHIYYRARTERFARESLGDSNRRLRRILRELPDYSPARAQLANAYERAGRTPDALRTLRAGRTPDALRTLRAGLAVAPDDPGLAQQLQALSARRASR